MKKEKADYSAQPDGGYLPRSYEVEEETKNPMQEYLPAWGMQIALGDGTTIARPERGLVVVNTIDFSKGEYSVRETRWLLGAYMAKTPANMGFGAVAHVGEIDRKVGFSAILSLVGLLAGDVIRHETYNQLGFVQISQRIDAGCGRRLKCRRTRLALVVYGYTTETLEKAQKVWTGERYTREDIAFLRNVQTRIQVLLQALYETSWGKTQRDFLWACNHLGEW